MVLPNKMPIVLSNEIATHVVKLPEPEVSLEKYSLNKDIFNSYYYLFLTKTQFLNLRIIFLGCLTRAHCSSQKFSS